MTQILFWDIDGTLLTTARAGVFAVEEAAREICGATPDFSRLNTAGLTDAEVAALAIAECGGNPSPATISAFLRSYEHHLPERLHLRRGQVLPGVQDILEELDLRPDVACYLLTGNTPAGARAKLAHYGLERFFPAGAFCTEDGDRATIARRALEVAAGELGRPIDVDAVYVIGDTPHDIRCGRAIGARTVAVASGAYSREELEAFDPWRALDALPGPESFAELIELPTRTAPKA
jgi:phosphoglycolate phosphatase-like HAD superfamily hydrolase